jgi:hypothetical protein
MKTIILLICLISSLTAWSQESEVAGIFQNEQRTFHCERYKTLLSSFDEMSKSEIKAKIEDEVNGYNLLLKASKLSYREKRIYKQNRAVLKKLLQFQELKTSERKEDEEFCKVAQAAVLGIAQGLGWGANGIMSVAAIPFQAVWKFGRAAVTGEKKDGPGDNQYDFFGPQIYGGMASNLLFSERYIGLAIANPWLIPLIAAPWIDSKVMNLCKKKNSLRPEEERYCKRFIGFKTTMSTLSEPAEDAGEWLHNLVVGKKQNVKDTATFSQEEILKDLTKITNENFCQNMVKIGVKYRASRKEIQAKANQETWRLGTNPERYGIPAIADFISSKDRIELPAESPQRYRNVVISLGPASYELVGVDQKAALKNYKAKYKIFKKQAKIGRKIFQEADTIAECERLRKVEKFDYESFEKLAIDIEDDLVGKKLYEHSVIKAQFNSKASPFLITGGTKLKWEIVENGDITTIHEILYSPDVANVIMVIHGTEKGKIIDSEMNEIPRTFFRNLSPNLMSLNFFSCYSQKIDNYYGLSEEFNNSKSSNALRHLSFVELDKSYSYQAGQVPFASFGGYLSQIDLSMYHTLRGNLLYQDLARNLPKASAGEICKLNVENLGNKKVTYGITINNVQVGALTPDKASREFSFNCSILKDSNKLRVLDIQIEQDEPLTVDDSQFTIIRPAGVTKLETSELTVTRLNGNVMGINGTFEKKKGPLECGPDNNAST